MKELDTPSALGTPNYSVKNQKLDEKVNLYIYGDIGTCLKLFIPTLPSQHTRPHPVLALHPTAPTYPRSHQNVRHNDHDHVYTTITH
jgi:hypothetical protein